MDALVRHKQHGFSLVELAIVLVILGLLVGTVMEGQALINSAEVKAQLSQIDRYNAAVRAFQGKYLALPGDMASVDAMRFNFYRDGSNGKPDSGCSHYNAGGCGDGNGAIGLNTGDGQGFQTGETHLFWLDLQVAGLVEGQVTTYADTDTASNDVSAYLPQGKINGQYLYVWNGGVPPDYTQGSANDGYNYLALSGVLQFTGYNNGLFSHTAASMRVIDAYNMDMKVDDGLPQTGSVTAVYTQLASSQVQSTWVGASSAYSGAWWGGPTTAATPATPTTCYDNQGNAGTKQTYSVSLNNGENMTCALSFRMR